MSSWQSFDAMNSERGGAYVVDSILFRDQFGTDEMRAVFSDGNTVQKWLDVEAALASVQSRLGIIPESAAVEIIEKSKVELIDLHELKREMDRTSHPIVPLLRAMKNICVGDAGEYIHWGATTQDITDTGTVLQIREALDVLGVSYAALKESVTTLAKKYRDTTMVGRSHGQQALPITFGYKAAIWLEEIKRNLSRLEEARNRVLVGQFSGAVGTLAALGDKGIEVQTALFEELDLGEPQISWHVSRDNLAELICVLSISTATIGKIAHEIYCLQKTEVAELEEPFAMGKIGSSTMPHKRNPPACEGIIAIARLIRGSAPIAIEAVMAEHERDKVVLQMEREFISRTFCLAHAAVKKAAVVITGLSVRADRMERNLFVQKGLLLSEAVMMKLSDTLGRQEAHEIVYQICMEVFESDRDLKSALMSDIRVSEHVSEAEIDEMLDPKLYTGQAGIFVDRVLSHS